MQRGSLSSEIKSAVRRRIILHSDSKDLVIYEGKLAKEFGVSRTPVRQVIQSLAAERMVEVRSGVGTIATPLRYERRLKDMQSFSSVLKACSECSADNSINLVLVELSSLRMFLEDIQDDLPSDIFFDVCNKFADILAELVEDAILKDAVVACYWRYVRRRLAERDQNFGFAINEMIALIVSAKTGAKEGNSENVLRAISATIDEIIIAAQQPAEEVWTL